jgi:phenylpropionate dioxygenase-like ring-hydroxylating dioxygenase large terminal subunit
MNDHWKGPLDQVPFRVTHPERVPTQRYYDEAFFKLECERLWPHVWQMACRLEEIPEVGDWVEYKILDKSVIVVRTKSGVKAFHNACRHRGVQLASGRGSCEVQGFICPFHGWRWNIDGVNTFVLGKHLFSEANLDADDINLVPCRVELWGGCAFINFDDEAPPFRESLGPMAERLEARNIDKVKMEWWRATILPTNWKLAMEAFMEGYHTLRTHPQLLTPLGVDEAAVSSGAPRSLADRVGSSREFCDRMIEYLRVLSDGMAGQVHSSEVDIAETIRDMEMPVDKGAWEAAFYARLKDEIARRGRARGLPVPDLNTVDATYPFTPVEFFFPHYFLLPTFSAFASYRIRPLGPESCIFELWSLVLTPEGEAHERVTEPTWLPYDSKDYPEIPQQDYSNLPLQQLGLHAGGFEYMRLSNAVEGLIGNYQRLIDGYLAGLPREAIAEASKKVNGSFNVPVCDIGF